MSDAGTEEQAPEADGADRAGGSFGGRAAAEAQPWSPCPPAAREAGPAPQSQAPSEAPLTRLERRA